MQGPHTLFSVKFANNTITKQDAVQMSKHFILTALLIKWSITFFFKKVQ